MASINIKQETRLCTVNGEPGYFHCWGYYYSKYPLEVDSIEMTGRVVYGIVEFADRVERVDPVDIKFCDEENTFLNEMAKHMKKECQKPIILSEDEKTILKNIDKRYKWIARSYGTLEIFEDKPYKCDCDDKAWNIRKGSNDILRPFNHLFAFIKATDEEPYSIEDLLFKLSGNKIKENEE